jgi:hypothetical protein
MKFSLMVALASLMFAAPAFALGPINKDGGIAAQGDHHGGQNSGQQTSSKGQDSKGSNGEGGGGGGAMGAGNGAGGATGDKAGPGSGILSDFFSDDRHFSAGEAPVHGAPGPEMGAGLPILVFAGGLGVFWCMRRARRKRVQS